MSDEPRAGDPHAYSFYMRGFEAGMMWRPALIDSAHLDRLDWIDALRDGWNAGVAARLLAVQTAARRFDVEPEGVPVDRSVAAPFR